MKVLMRLGLKWEVKSGAEMNIWENICLDEVDNQFIQFQTIDGTNAMVSDLVGPITRWRKVNKVQSLLLGDIA